jgi:nitrate reductase NapE component
MNLAAPSLKPMLAFVSTVVFVLAYFVVVLALTHPRGVHKSSVAGGMHVVLVWVPLIASAAFYSWVSRGAAVSQSRHLVQVAVATVLAPIVAVSIVGLVGFVLLGWSM